MRDNLAVQHLAETVKTASLVQQWKLRSAQVRPGTFYLFSTIGACPVIHTLSFKGHILPQRTCGLWDGATAVLAQKNVNPLCLNVLSCE